MVTVTVPISVNWPIVVFERGGWALVATRRETVPDLYDRGWFESAVAAFDADGHPLTFFEHDDTLAIGRLASADWAELANAGRTSLKRHFSDSRWRRTRANRAESAAIDALSPREVLAAVVSRFSTD